MTTMQAASMEALPDRRGLDEGQIQARAAAFLAEIQLRRSVRDFSDRPVQMAVIADAVRAAGRAPSGANQQPWHFAVITDPARKRRLRILAEQEEYEFYHGRAPGEWLDALAALGTNASKPFLETAPVLIAIFAQRHGIAADGSKVKHYYVPESVGIATGFLIAALHHAGLATLTHTPSPMNFLNEICGRPEHEKPTILLIVGHPAEGCEVPVAGGIKKPLEEIASFL
jgi:nitroreductase